MQPPPTACLCRGGISWQGILLAVSLLTFWNPHPTAQLTIEPVPFDAAEGTDVLLLVHNASRNLIGYNWFKRKTADNSHKIVSYMVSRQNDTGFYTLQTVTANATVELATGEFRVHVSLLTFWNPHPTAQLTIEPVPFDAAVETDVLLLVHNASQNTIGYYWFKGNTTEDSREIISYSILTQKINTGPAFSGRETLYTNGSLLFMNVTKEDTGFYTLRTLNNELRPELATGEIRVHGLVAQPSLRATNTEPHSVAMTCFSDDPGISITWILNSQTLQLTDRMQLSPDHSTLSIDSVRQEDAGEYQCEASTPASSTRSDRYRLAVICEWPPSHPVLPSHISLSRAIIWHQP
uniref:Ig-like domain-containing protein n=1 Tax=Spermophilus dauricus TaxID=99837 RepID=A0A8C9QPI9_SPEDA